MSTWATRRSETSRKCSGTSVVAARAMARCSWSATDPGGVEHVLEEGPLGLGKRLQVEMRGPARKRGRAVGVHPDELQPLGKHLPVTRLHLMRKQEHQPRVEPVVGRVDEHRAAAEQIGVFFQEHVAHGEHERMPGVHQHGTREARLVERLQRFLLEADAVIPFQDRLGLAAVPARDATITLADGGRNVGNLESA